MLCDLLGGCGDLGGDLNGTGHGLSLEPLYGFRTYKLAGKMLVKQQRMPILVAA
jgi:hypothetical protein